MQHSLAKNPTERAGRPGLVEPPQHLDIAQAVNLAKPVDIAEFANLTNCKMPPRIVNPNGRATQLVWFFRLFLE
jgi:hypothetical protein